jgi:hypothetical protein
MAYSQVTLVQLRAQLLQRLGGAGAKFWTTAELNTYIQESLRVFNSLTGFWRTRLLLPTVANQVWYPVSGTVTSSLRVAWNNFPLNPVSMEDLDTGRQHWESETIVDGGDVPATPQLFAIGALNLIAIWPADTAASNSLQVDGIASTPLLAADSDFIDIGTEELTMLLDYCEHAALFKEGGAEFAATLPSDENPGSILGNFLKQAAKRNATLMNSELYRLWMGGDVNGREANPQRTKSERAGAR